MAGERRLGAYQLLAPLATGGMAELFIAKTVGVSGFEKQVALKVIHPNFSSEPDFIRMLIDEAKLAVQLQHANIVQTYDLGQVNGQYYIAMELVDGADLYKLLKTSSERGLDFPIDVAVHITSEVASGLDYAHRKNDPIGRPLMIVHRDVSPQNVLVSYEGEVKIVDFGIAKAALRNQQTQAGVIKGKYYYMSPEQAWGNKIDARTDVFSTGILLHEMLSGEMLYLEDDLDTLIKMVRAAEVQPPSRKRPDVPPDLDAIVMKALAKRPEDRYQSAADLSTALTRFLRARYPELHARGWPPSCETRWSAAAAARRSRCRRRHPKSYATRTASSSISKRSRGATSCTRPTPKRRNDQQTRGGVEMPRGGHEPSDYEEPASTVIDSRPMSGMRDAGTDPNPVGAPVGVGLPPSASGRVAGFGEVGDEGEPTKLAPTSGPGSRAQLQFTEDEHSTDRHASSRLPGAPSERPRRPSLAAGRRRSRLGADSCRRSPRRRPRRA